MKTVVLQSYRTFDIPIWIDQSMESVRRWAGESGFDYRRLGDEFLSLVPTWYRDKASVYFNIITDLARLELIKMCLKEGYDRCIWFDADVVIFAPARLTIDPSLAYAFCEEIWIARDDKDVFYCDRRVNNSVCCFRQPGYPTLEVYIEECLRVVRTRQIRDELEVGTRLLTRWRRRTGLPTISHIGLLNPAVLHGLVTNDADILKLFMVYHGQELYAANLCHSYRRSPNPNQRIDDDRYMDVLKLLLESDGRILNDRL
jgi:hypothetical protein